jgi:hypothetical protein
MALRALAPDDGEVLVAFVAMAALSPGDQDAAGALTTSHVRRWLDGWGDELGVVWEHDGRVVGAAWATNATGRRPAVRAARLSARRSDTDRSADHGLVRSRNDGTP